MKSKLLILAMLITIALVGFPSACGGATTTITQTVTITASTPTVTVTTYPPAEPPAAGMVVIVIGGGYADGVAYVDPGAKFMWINQDHESHTVTSDRIPPAFDFTLAPGQSVVTSIDQEGDYLYYDKLGNGQAKIVVSSD